MSNTVLIVDDCEFERHAFRKAFEHHGFTVVTTGDPNDVIPYAVGFTPDFVLLDLNMPEVSGFELCARLEQDRRTQNIPIMFVTASDDVSDAIRSFHLGVIDYIHKPIGIDHLVETVLKHKVINTIQECWRPARDELLKFARKYSDE